MASTRSVEIFESRTHVFVICPLCGGLDCSTFVDDRRPLRCCPYCHLVAVQHLIRLTEEQFNALEKRTDVELTLMFPDQDCSISYIELRDRRVDFFKINGWITIRLDRPSDQVWRGPILSKEEQVAMWRRT